jgi:hypothetical protein
MKLTGHKTEAVYRRYAIVSSADLREAISKVATLQLGAAPPAPSKVASIEQARVAHTRKVPARFRRLDGNKATAGAVGTV